MSIVVETVAWGVDGDELVLTLSVDGVHEVVRVRLPDDPRLREGELVGGQVFGRDIRHMGGGYWTEEIV